MIDYIKAISKSEVVSSSLLNSKLLDFQREVNEDTGELSHKSYRESLYKGLKFRVYDKGYSMIMGSLHKFCNSGNHNYNDFNYENLVSVLLELESNFLVDLSKWELQNVEIGLNITPPVSASATVKSLLVHRMKIFKYYSIANSEYKQAIHSNYYIKAYSKTMQYNLSDEVFRFEIKYRKMMKLKEISINTVNDLKNRWKLKLALDLLYKEWESVLLYDPTINESNLSNYHKNVKIWQWKSAERWVNDLGKNQRSRELKKLEEVAVKLSDNIKKSIAGILKRKGDELLNNCRPSNRLLINNNCGPFNSLYIVEEGISNYPIISTHFDLQKLTNSKPLVKRYKSKYEPSSKDKKLLSTCDYFQHKEVRAAS